MRFDEFVSSLPHRELTWRQLENIQKIQGLSRGFHEDAGTTNQASKLLDKKVESHTVVLESSHMPKFLTHSSTWKKIFLLEVLRLGFENEGRDVIALFGFDDCEIASTPFLSNNRVPAPGEEGFLEVGFDLPVDERGKSFCFVDKPSSAEWDAELRTLREFYLMNMTIAGLDMDEIMGSLDSLLDVMEVCYDRAESFSDMNCFLFSRVCNKELGVKALFFRYSDVLQKGVFLDDSLRLLSNFREYNRLYNEAVGEFWLVDVPKASPDSLPFWLQCDCGLKSPLVWGEFECPRCGRDYIVDDLFLRTSVGKLDSTFVARNLIFASGLGSTLFLSGIGDSLRHGRISKYIGDSLGVVLPANLAVSGVDFYLGLAQGIVLQNLCGVFGLEESDFLNRDVFESKVNSKLAAGGGQELCGLLDLARRVFSLDSSVFDLLVFFGFDAVRDAWRGFSGFSVGETDGFYSMDLSVCYDPVDKEYLPRLYETLTSFKAECH